MFLKLNQFKMVDLSIIFICIETLFEDLTYKNNYFKHKVTCNAYI